MVVFTWGSHLVVVVVLYSHCVCVVVSIVVLGSLVQSGLLSNFDKTGTETGPHRLKNLEKLNRTDVNRFSAVFIGFLRLTDRLNQSQSQLVEDWLRPVSELLI
jgi:hypothetical protein